MRDYSYDGDNRLTGISDGTSFQYDGNGSVTQKTDGSGTTLYSYDVARRLTQVQPPVGSTVSFVYDGDGARTKKTTNQGTTSYVEFVDMVRPSGKRNRRTRTRRWFLHSQSVGPR